VFESKQPCFGFVGQSNRATADRIVGVQHPLSNATKKKREEATTRSIDGGCDEELRLLMEWN